MNRWKQKLFRILFLLLSLYPLLLLLKLDPVACIFYGPFTAVMHKRKN